MSNNGAALSQYIAMIENKYDTFLKKVLKSIKVQKEKEIKDLLEKFTIKQLLNTQQKKNKTIDNHNDKGSDDICNELVNLNNDYNRDNKQHDNPKIKIEPNVEKEEYYDGYFNVKGNMRLPKNNNDSNNENTNNDKHNNHSSYEYSGDDSAYEYSGDDSSHENNNNDIHNNNEKSIKEYFILCNFFECNFNFWTFSTTRF